LNIAERVSGYQNKMNRAETLKKLNKKIDELIIKGKENTAEYKRLCKLHLAIVREIGWGK
jgi:hypothetical protein